MPILGRFYDGRVAIVRTVELHYLAEYETGSLLIGDAVDGSVIARWTASDLHTVPSRRTELRLAAKGEPAGARVMVQGAQNIAQIKATLPVLGSKQRREAGRQVRIAVATTLTLGTVIAAYLYGVPLLASRIVGLVPIAWEQRLGATAAEQMQSSLGGFVVCDPDPGSPANRALARFGQAALAGSGTPFSLDINVVRSDVPNAFALPGGQVFFLSALLDQAQSPDEFAGVLAHEIGHVFYHHGMEQLISSAGTGALIGFILGDMTGLSLAAGLGSAIIDARFSRDAERQADLFAARLAQRLDFDPSGLADLLTRVGRDDDFSRALALLNTHPLTDDRKAALALLGQQRPTGLEPPFSTTEWRAIKAICGGAVDQRGAPINIGQAKTK
ncbi:MAG: M48 family metallopeptidase [Candidatus Devosia euplotis]|nr:M48 family metallopeptidase [Candidatus Devosia euplotis]